MIAAHELLWLYLILHLCVGLFLNVPIGVIPPRLLRRVAREKSVDHAYVRETIETAVTRLVRFLIVPGFWILAGEWIGLAVWAVVFVLSLRFRPFRILERVLGIVPTWGAVLFVAVAALIVPRSSPWRALSTAVKQGRVYVGWALAATAGALNVTLGGPQAWIGPKDSSARLTAADLDRAAMLQYVLYLCLIVALSSFIIL